VSELDLKAAVKKFRTIATQMEELAPLLAKLDGLENKMASPGDKAAKKARKRSAPGKVGTNRYRTGSHKTPSRAKITDAPTHGGQLPAPTKEFAE